MGLSNNIIFVVGGARSGKSSFAQSLAEKYGNRIVYLATAEPSDEEMKNRINHHQKSRPTNWLTIEEGRYLIDALENVPEDTSALLLDCLTLWLHNIILDGWEEQATLEFYHKKESYIMGELEHLLDSLSLLACPVIIVSNEVGMGIVPEYPLSRFFRDVAGRVNQKVAAQAGEVYFVVAGIFLKIK